ncbi:MAG: glycosyltransferase [Bacteroidetes bacterium]|nr:glycosyltransferase [Bacteroidota bacterium]
MRYFCYVKILFVANRMPYPPYRGDKLKIYNLATELSANHELHLITIAENQEDLDSISALQKPLFTSIQYVYRPKWRSALSAALGLFSKRPIQVSYFRSKAFAQKLKQLLDDHDFDAIHVQHLRMAQYFEEGAPSNAILDLPDAFSLYWKRRELAAKNPLDKAFRSLEFSRLAQYEKWMLPKFPQSLVCSAEDRDYLINAGITNVDVLPNGVNLKSFSPQGSDAIIKNRILFTGNMDYAPNVDAVQYFVNDIFPLILEKHPDSRFVIAGQRPVKAVLDLVSDRIEVTGFIENLASEYAKANVVVSPLRIGAGTQNKVLEALAMNQAVVCSKVGFLGLGLKSGEGILMGDTAQEFATHVVSILQSDELRKNLGETGGLHVRKTFAWSGISKQLLTYFEKITA